MKRVKCPICGYYTFKDGLGLTFDICPVCFWEDDIFDYDEPDADTGANCVSLQEARENYLKIGAIHPDFKKYVRPPKKMKWNKNEVIICMEAV